MDTSGRHVPAELRLGPDSAFTRGGRQVVRTIQRLQGAVKKTRYQARTVIRPRQGVYAWDCSGMAAWILRRAAPRAFSAMGRGRPLARHFYRAIEGAPIRRSRRGWQRLSHISEARAGDLFAWLRSPLSRSRVTGHVGFFVGRPTPLPDHPRLYLARILDATSLPHQNDTRTEDGEGGFGFSTILFVTDESGEAVAYGWFGSQSLQWGVLPAKINFGRVVR